MPLQFIPGKNSNALDTILRLGLLNPDANANCLCPKEIPTVEKTYFILLDPIILELHRF